MQRTFCFYCGRAIDGRQFCLHCGKKQIAWDGMRFERMLPDYTDWLEKLLEKIRDQSSENRSRRCSCMDQELMQLGGLVVRAAALLSRLHWEMRYSVPVTLAETKAVLSKLSRLAGQFDQPEAQNLRLVCDGAIRELLERNEAMIFEISCFEAAENRRKNILGRSMSHDSAGPDIGSGDFTTESTFQEDELRKTAYIRRGSAGSGAVPGDVSSLKSSVEPGSRLVSDASEQSPACAAILDDVEFRVAAPKTLTRGCSALVKFMMYAADEFEKADRIVKYMADQVAQNVGGEVELARGTTLRICMQSRDVEIEDASREMVWRGRFASCDFKVTVPEDFSGRQIELTARVYRDLAVLTDLKLILDAAGGSVSEPARRCTLKSAFLSYSSSDRSRVIACMRGMLLAREDMDLFIDVIRLRRGEHWEPRIYREIDRRDLFYLFWSRSAAQSEWVNRELEYALKTKGEAAIEPVPLELPEVCPPPAALNGRHFNDWMLLYELQCGATENKQ